jgi:hypothetical protein
MANKFTLHGEGVEISYTAGITPGLVALMYKDGSVTKNFKSNEISTDTSVIDQIVTIVLERTIDFGATTFSFFLPDLNVPQGESVNFKSLGIRKEVHGPVVNPALQKVSWHAVHLHGVAQTVIVPL